MIVDMSLEIMLFTTRSRGMKRKNMKEAISRKVKFPTNSSYWDPIPGTYLSLSYYYCAKN